MNIFPKHSEVLVSSYSPEEVAGKMQSVTHKVNYLDHLEAADKKHLFNGVVDTKSFRLSLNIIKADSFLPLITGKIEPVHHGCILFLNYSLFPSAVFFLAFWGIVTLFAAVFLFFYDNQWLYACASFLAGIGNFVFAHYYFKKKLKQSQLIFHQMLSLQEKN